VLFRDDNFSSVESFDLESTAAVNLLSIMASFFSWISINYSSAVAFSKAVFYYKDRTCADNFSISNSDFFSATRAFVRRIYDLLDCDSQ
jgi:hypothetical protein